MVEGSQRVFISYRRVDTGIIAGRIYDRLSASIGAGRIYMDVYANEAGDEFSDRIRQALNSAAVFVALVGPAWEKAKLPRADGRACGTRPISSGRRSRPPWPKVWTSFRY